MNIECRNKNVIDSVFDIPEKLIIKLLLYVLKIYIFLIKCHLC